MFLTVERDFISIEVDIIALDIDDMGHFSNNFLILSWRNYGLDSYESKVHVLMWNSSIPKLLELIIEEVAIQLLQVN